MPEVPTSCHAGERLQSTKNARTHQPQASEHLPPERARLRHGGAAVRPEPRQQQNKPGFPPASAPAPATHESGSPTSQPPRGYGLRAPGPARRPQEGAPEGRKPERHRGPESERPGTSLPHGSVPPAPRSASSGAGGDVQISPSDPRAAQDPGPRSSDDGSTALEPVLGTLDPVVVNQSLQSAQPADVDADSSEQPLLSLRCSGKLRTEAQRPVLVQILRESLSQKRKPDQAPENPHRGAALQVQVLREVLQHLQQPPETRQEHPQQGEAFQVSALREMLRSADELGPTSQKARR